MNFQTVCQWLLINLYRRVCLNYCLSIVYNSLTSFFDLRSQKDIAVVVGKYGEVGGSEDFLIVTNPICII